MMTDKQWAEHEEAAQRLEDFIDKVAIAVLPAFVAAEPMRHKENARMAYAQAHAFVQEKYRPSEAEPKKAPVPFPPPTDLNSRG